MDSDDRKLVGAFRLTGRLGLPGLLCLLGLAGMGVLQGCGGTDSSGLEASAAVYGNRVIAYQPVMAEGTTAEDWPWFFDASQVLGAPGDAFSVVSLGYDPGVQSSTGGTLTLGLGQLEQEADRQCVVDGAGDDLAIYENPFQVTDPDSGELGTNNEVLTVALSEDGITYYEFPPLVDTSLSLIQPERYGNLAGVTPVSEGGDTFDLAALIAYYQLSVDFRGCYVLLTDGGTAYEDYGNTQSDLYLSGADINAVEALYSMAVPGQEP